jgi:hypothetical protein
LPALVEVDSMSQSVGLTPAAPASAPPRTFALAGLAVATAAAALAGWAPLAFSVVTVFLFAGPHNWFEFRYFLTRLPARWGRLRGFFTLAFAGMGALTASFVALLWLGETGGLDRATWQLASSVWDTALLLWVAALAELRSRQNPRRSWGWVWPACFALAAVAWLYPTQWSLALVYLHPLMAFWLLDRELRRSRPEWRPALHLCLACLPLFLLALWWKLGAAEPLPEDRDLNVRIAWQAGAGVLPGVSTHLLVAAHAFLEMMHYGVWIVVMPLVGLRAAPWRLDRVPLARRSSAWRRGVGVFLLVGLGVVLALWGFFLADYPTTRLVYFAVAIFHVLAEAPFLLRSL